VKRKVKQALTYWTKHVVAEVNGKESSNDRRPLTPRDIWAAKRELPIGQGLQKISNHFDYVGINNLEVPANFVAILKKILKSWSRTFRKLFQHRDLLILMRLKVCH
jgi:hypothetical protein